jgi:hypothetical protein
MIRWASLLTAVTASVLGAQANIPQLRGDVGLRAGTQAPPGVSAGVLFNNYESLRIVAANGAASSLIRPIINTAALTAVYSSSVRILGGRWAAIVAVPWANFGLAVPNVDLLSNRWGISDSYLVPLQLGWKFERGDLLVGQGLYAPTGRFHDGARDNTGLGMWSWESTLGGTVYITKARTLNASTLASYQVQSTVRGTDRRAGQVLTLEGGLGHAISEGTGQAGVAYYARWKTTSDENFQQPPAFAAKDRTFGVGPEITTPVAAKPFVTIVTLRYYFEGGNRVATEGNSFYLIATAYLPPAAAQ